MEQARTDWKILILKVWMHVTATLVIAAVLGFMVADRSSIGIFLASIHQGYDPDWSPLLLHMGLSAGIWASMVALWHVATRERKNKPVTVFKARGAVMLETLIALVPFLLLTSGIAQLAMINVASIISDLAIYQAARTAWIWQPEVASGRAGVTDADVKFRARIAAALTLAPTASSEFLVGRNHAPGSGPPFRRIRTGIAASFNLAPVTGHQYWNQTGQNWNFFHHQDLQATADNLTFIRAFDTDSFAQRAGRKCTSAWMNLENFTIINDGNKVGARFTYRYTLLFPWFAYIFGKTDTIAMRTAHYMPIKRAMTFRKQPSM